MKAQQGARRKTRDAQATRARLVEQAAALFNRVGYHGTDSNRIARAAGYAPATFYKHFADKHDILLVAYERSVSMQWAEIAAVIGQGGSRKTLVARLVKLVIRQHRRELGLRASIDFVRRFQPRARAVCRKQRRVQLGLMDQLQVRIGAPRRSREQNAMVLLMFERVCDAIADGEVRALGLGLAGVERELRRLLSAHLGA